MSETVLVTGGTGYVGGWCIVELLKRGFTTRTTIRNAASEATVKEALASAGQSAKDLTFFAADLTKDEGWDTALAGCDYVLHVASPLGTSSPEPDALMTPARDGTLRVLRAAKKAGVKRVVISTSAAAAARPPRNSDIVSDESVWSDPDDRKWDAYRLSKILAERGAWDFIAENPGPTELTTILPGAVFGPLLIHDKLGSVRVIQGLLQGRPPRLPRIGFWIVDVRDLAELHVRAMTSPEAAGERFIATGDFIWFEDIAQALRDQLGDRAENVPTRRVPNAAVRLMSLFSPQLRFFVPELGRRNDTSSEKARRVLGFTPRPAAATIADCAESLLSRS